MSEGVRVGEWMRGREGERVGERESGKVGERVGEWARELGSPPAHIE